MTQPNSPMIRPLHGLRGLAALSVVWGHTAPAAFSASLGVVLFFALSGYLLARLYLDTPFSASRLRSYAVARFARVYPLFALVVIGTAALNAVTSLNIFALGPADVIAHLLLAGDALTIWTISVEFQFYAVFIALWAMRSRGWLGDPAVFALLAVAGVLAFAIPFEGRITLARYLFIFLAGAAIARLSIRQEWATIGLPLFALAYLAVGALDPRGPIYDNMWAVLACLGLLACAIHAPESPIGRLLSGRIPFWLGEISFGVYLLHRHAEWMARALVTEPWMRFALIVGLSLFMAQVAHVLIEKTARSGLRSLLDAPRPEEREGSLSTRSGS